MIPIHHSYAEIWADETLPIAREAYARLEFRNVKPWLVVATGEAIEKPTLGQNLYPHVGNRRRARRAAESRMASCRFTPEDFVAT
jgi:hypothetical protein